MSENEFDDYCPMYALCHELNQCRHNLMWGYRYLKCEIYLIEKAENEEIERLLLLKNIEEDDK